MSAVVRPGEGRRGPRGEVLRAAALMVFATVAFVAMQTLIRMVASDPVHPLPPFEVAFFRNLFGVLVLVPLVERQGPRALVTRHFRWHIFRAALQTFGMLSFFMALTLAPLAEVTALSFSAPLFATVLAVVVLGERIRLRRVSALVAGFVGVLVVLQPGLRELGLGSVLVLISSAAWAASMTVIKHLSRFESAVTLTVYAGVLMSLLTLGPALWVWVTPDWGQLAWLGLIGVLGSAGQVAFAQSLRLSDLSAVLPLDFLRLVWASLTGFLLFGERPEPASWLGGGLIFGAATYIAVRESRVRVQARADGGTAGGGDRSS